MHHKLIYIKRTNVMQLGSKFICNCNIAILQLQINIMPSCITLVLFIYINSDDLSPTTVKSSNFHEGNDQLNPNDINWLVFERPAVRKLSYAPTVVTEDFRGSSRSINKNACNSPHMGKHELRPAVKKLYQLLPKVTASSVSVESRVFNHKHTSCVPRLVRNCIRCIER